MALLPWAAMKQEVEGDLFLLTLDHHCDTNSSYLRSLFKQVGRDVERIEALRRDRLKTIDIKDEVSVTSALVGLHHDEHIDAAIRLGVIQEAFIIQHSFYHVLPEYAERGMSVWPTEVNLEEMMEVDVEAYYDLAIEDVFLERQLLQLPQGFDLAQEKYILDIDLDYFKTRQALHPKESRVLKDLIDHAVGVTVAKESGWVERLFRGEPWSSDEIWDQLKALLNDG